jgi:hypothetical protein
MNVPYAAEVMNLVLKLVDPKLFVRKSVKQLITGYDDPLMFIANKLLPSAVPTSQFSLLRGVSI